MIPFFASVIIYCKVSLLKKIHLNGHAKTQRDVGTV